MQLIAINRLTALDFKDKKEMPQKLKNYTVIIL